MSKPRQQTPQEALGAAVARCRGLVQMNQVELARAALVSQGSVSDAESGKRLVAWGLIDALCAELREQELAVEAAELRELRSRIEAPGMGEPGTVALCLNPMNGDIDAWHWVRRQPGQIYCDVHEESELIGTCPACGYEYWRTGDRGRWCAGCSIPISALKEHVREEPKGDLAQAIEQHRAEARAALEELGVQIPVFAANLMSEAERIRQHNQELGKPTLAALAERERNHYLAARSLAEVGLTEFTRAQFVARYLEVVPGADATHALPSDYRIGVKRSGRRDAWFLSKPARNLYRFVGLDGDGDQMSETDET